jgi:hypothetical protein
LAIVALSLAVPALAEERLALAPGSRVRIRTSEGRGSIRGTLASLDDQRLTLEEKPGAAPRVIDRSQIARLELSAGRRTRGHGAALGAAIGLGAGLLFTGVVAARESCEGYGAEDCGLATAVSLIVFTPALTATGALVGVALPPSERWVTVPSTPAVRQSGPSPLGLRLTLRF